MKAFLVLSLALTPGVHAQDSTSRASISAPVPHPKHLTVDPRRQMVGFGADAFYVKNGRTSYILVSLMTTPGQFMTFAEIDRSSFWPNDRRNFVIWRLAAKALNAKSSSAVGLELLGLRDRGVELVIHWSSVDKPVDCDAFLKSHRTKTYVPGAA